MGRTSGDRGDPWRGFRGQGWWSATTAAAVDTSGFLGDRATDEFLDLVDLFLLDIKSGDPDTYRLVTRGADQCSLEAETLVPVAHMRLPDATNHGLNRFKYAEW